MARCENCRYWDAQDDGQSPDVFSPPLRTGTCTRAIAFWDATEWIGADAEDKYFADHPEEWRNTVRRLKPEFSDRRFFAQDGSDYRAFVLTTPDFFCADFAAKDPDPSP